VRNKRDGTVEAVIEGERQKVASMLDWCRQGPPRAVVNQVDVEWEEYTGEMADFRVTY
jgi:acylphosphatase